MKTKLSVILLLLMLFNLMYLIVRYQAASSRLNNLTALVNTRSVTDRELALLYEARAKLMEHPEQKEKNPYDAGIILRQHIMKHGLSLIGYRIINEKEKTVLEFNCKGSSYNTLRFLYTIAAESFMFKEVVLTDQGRGEMQLVFKIYL